MNKIVRITGACPEKGSAQSAKFTFAPVWLGGQSAPRYELLSIECDYAADNGCALGKNCPLIPSARARLH